MKRKLNLFWRVLLRDAYPKRWWSHVTQAWDWCDGVELLLLEAFTLIGILLGTIVRGWATIVVLPFHVVIAIALLVRNRPDEVEAVLKSEKGGAK